jgi:hypothetical protein
MLFRNLKKLGLIPYNCKTEDEAREMANSLQNGNNWPCLFTKSDTTGEKDFEEFFTDEEVLDLEKYENLGVIKNQLSFSKDK